MTEFEMAEAVRSQIAITQTQVDLACGMLDTFVSYLFAYLIAAYFIGEKLTRVQTWVVTLLYLYVVVLNRLGAYQAFNDLGKLHAELAMLAPDKAQELPVTATLYAIQTFSVAAVIASLYFMWSMRHPKTG